MTSFLECGFCGKRIEKIELTTAFPPDVCQNCGQPKDSPKAGSCKGQISEIPDCWTNGPEMGLPHLIEIRSDDLVLEWKEFWDGTGEVVVKRLKLPGAKAIISMLAEGKPVELFHNEDKECSKPLP